MNKELMVISCPASSRSGYGAHARDIIRSLIKMDRFDIKIIDLRWGDTPRNALDPIKDNDITSRILRQNLTQQPDIFIQITVPNEFNPIGKYNIGITAGMETTMVHHDWLIGCNKMDLIIVPSKHSKATLESTKYDMHDNVTKQKVGIMQLEKPVDILFEGADTNIFSDKNEISNIVNDKLEVVKEKFNFLFVGHWLKGDLGQDRKDIGMLIKIFLETFKDIKNKPGLILKTSHATFSVMDRENILSKIKQIKDMVGGNNLPNIYLIFGDLSDDDMNSLYNHKKVKAHISFTKGEGFGRPLLEASLSGRPVIASNWSGHLDFLKEYSILLPGNVTQVHPSASWDKMILKDAGWFTVDYNYASQLMKDIFKNYKKYQEKTRKQKHYSKTNFSWDKMHEEFCKILDSRLIKKVELTLPRLPKLKIVESKLPELPKLKKIEKSVDQSVNVQGETF